MWWNFLLKIGEFSQNSTSSIVWLSFYHWSKRKTNIEKPETTP
jgi:hypothetical protein